MTFRCTLLLAIATIASAQEEMTRQDLERELRAQRLLLSDWASLTRYGSDNSEIKLKEGEDRVVFLGDEITEKWGEGSGQFFPGKPYINRGIAHQTTPQMLVRFRQDVISLKPKVVVIQAGSNDLARNSGPITESMAGENFMSMVELAKAHGIRVVLASVTPVCDCFERITKIRPPVRIMGLNNWLKDYAEKSGSIFLNYYAALAEGRNMRKELTVDGFLPNEAGYEKMARLAEEAIQKALATR